MRCYFVFFEPSNIEHFTSRVKSLEDTAGLPSHLVHSKVDSTKGAAFGFYVTEDTTKRFPQFLTEFPGGEWLDCP